MSTKGHKFSLETRAKMSASAIARHARDGYTEERRRVQSEAMKRVWADPEKRKKLRLNKRKFTTKERKERARLCMRNIRAQERKQREAEKQAKRDKLKAVLDAALPVIQKMDRLKNQNQYGIIRKEKPL